MATQGVEGQGRVVLLNLGNPAIGHQPQLDQRLEAVANAQHQAIPSFQQLGNRLGYSGIAEGSSDKLAGAIRLVAAGKAAGQHDDLSVLNRFHHRLDGFLNICGRQVLYDKHIGFSACSFKRPGGIHLAVCAGERGNKHSRLGVLNGGSLLISFRIQGHLAEIGLRLGSGGEHFLQGLLPGLCQGRQRQPLGTDQNYRFPAYGA